MSERAEGYAVMREGKIDIRTVSPTRRAAIVNDLVVNCACPVFAKTTDAQIEDLWREHRGEGVTIKVYVLLSKER